MKMGLFGKKKKEEEIEDVEDVEDVEDDDSDDDGDEAEETENEDDEDDEGEEVSVGLCPYCEADVVGSLNFCDIKDGDFTVLVCPECEKIISVA